MSDSIETSWEKGPDDAAARDRAADPQRRASYLGFVAHEVRNPLSTALWTAELLARMSAEERGGARGEKLSAMCLRSLSRVRQLVEDHFLCERLDAGGLPMRLEALALAEVLEAVMARKPIEPAQLQARLEGPVALDVDRGLTERVVEALVAAAGRSGGPVELAARTDGATAELRVRGEPPAADALEDPRKGSAPDPKGRALSLAVARRAAGVLGGGLTIQDGAFVLTLPAAGDTPPVPEAPTT